ncbi:MAG: Lrp/AsnC ligand binding domain-containing protein [Candidatus Bathyarchaeia archaeon]
MRAYLLIVTKPGTSEELVRDLRSSGKIEGLVQADSVYGRFDAIAVLEAPSLERISEIVYKIVEKHPAIVHTETAVCLF